MSDAVSSFAEKRTARAMAVCFSQISNLAVWDYLSLNAGFISFACSDATQEATQEQPHE